MALPEWGFFGGDSIKSRDFQGCSSGNYSISKGADNYGHSFVGASWLFNGQGTRPIPFNEAKIVTLVRPFGSVQRVENNGPITIVDGGSFYLLLDFDRNRRGFTYVAIHRSVLRWVVRGADMNNEIGPYRMFYFKCLGFVTGVIIFRRQRPVDRSIAKGLVRITSLGVGGLFPNVRLRPFGRNNRGVFRIINFFRDRPGMFFLLDSYCRLTFRDLRVSGREDGENFCVVKGTYRGPFVDLFKLLLLCGPELTTRNGLIGVVASLFYRITFPRRCATIRVPNFCVI